MLFFSFYVFLYIFAFDMWLDLLDAALTQSIFIYIIESLRIIIPYWFIGSASAFRTQFSGFNRLSAKVGLSAKSPVRRISPATNTSGLSIGFPQGSSVTQL